MAPDLNSLPPSSPTAFSRTMSNGSESGTPRPGGASSPSQSPSRSASISLQAAATMNAGLQHEPVRRSSSSSLSRNRQSPNASRRRSQVLMNLQMNDPSVPGPGEMVAGEGPPGPFGAASPHAISTSPLLVGGDPHHNRAPSLGELHQELEAEQEAQVNRLLHMIRQQQLQLQQLQSQGRESAIGEDTSERSTPALTPAVTHSNPQPIPTSQTGLPAHASSGSLPRSPGFPHHPRSSFDIARADLQRRSRTPSRGASPRLRSTSISQESGEPWLLGGRDESAFYQAETQMLTRENQMLRHRIRDLERQLAELNTGGTASVTHEPATHSQLTRSRSISEENPSPATQTPSAGAATTLPAVADTPKEE